MLNGTDISAHNLDVAPDGDFCIIKLTQGTGYVSSKAAAQVASARKKGQLIGFYHFPEYNTNVDANVANFLRELKKYLRPDDNVVLDHEADPPLYVPTPSEASKWGLSWLRRLAPAVSRVPWAYSNQAWAMGGYCAGMGDYPWWGAAPSVPKGQLTRKGPFKRIVAHQWTSTGGLDRDVFYGTRQDWISLAAPIGPQKGMDMLGGVLPMKKGYRITRSFPQGNVKLVGFAFDSPNVATYRIAVHYKGGHGEIKADVKVGGPASKTDAWPVKAEYPIVKPADANYFSITLMSDDLPPEIEPSWDAS